MSLPAMSLELRFCASRKSRTGEVGGCTHRMQTAWLPLGLAIEILGQHWLGHFRDILEAAHSLWGI